ncbi:hypothetical protein GCM10010512_48890 [Streptomyces thermoviolaceus subsp. thermoviolaceus]|nr:hypothetical protein GCM10010499_33550 [Streptomyces thermoviolaceus subsp. apingens]GHB11669.1 hypothetical protein GCM10010512_48890 [Streptomyces thermoviolaceus subsp. thermoviolaceus]
MTTSDNTKRTRARLAVRAACAAAAAWVAAAAVTATNASAAEPTRTGTQDRIGVQAAGGGLDYVAMGSSFAAGPGIPPVQDSPGASACSRSVNNYPSIVARDLGADLTDVTCSGATTANILTTSQNGQPPQVQAVTSDTRVVTVTIGGNDVNYLGSINVYSCQTSGGTNCGSVDRNKIEQTFTELPGRIANVVDAVHDRAPQAHVYLVTYFTILPDAGVCPDVPLTDEQAAYERSIASRLADATAAAASSTGATLVDLAGASRGHDACSADPWVESFRPASGRATYHPNEAGMRAAAALVESALAAAGETRAATFRSGIEGKCLDVRNSGTADGTPVQLWTCNGTDAQRWTYVPEAGGTLRAFGKCLDVTGNGTANGSKVQLWPCNGGGAQLWVPGPDGSLVNPQSGRCLDDPASTTQDGTQLQIWDCNGSNAQRWTPTA